MFRRLDRTVMHVIPNNILAMENALSDQSFIFLDASRVYIIVSRPLSSMLRALPKVIYLVQSLITYQIVT